MTNKERKSNLIRISQTYAVDMSEFGLSSFKPLLQLFSNTSPENAHLVDQKLVRTWSVFKTKVLTQQLLQHYLNTTPDFEAFSLILFKSLFMLCVAKLL